MFRQSLFLIGLGAVVVALAMSDGQFSTAQHKAVAMSKVNAADIGNSVQIIGRLGKPMTELVEIKGHWVVDRGTKASSNVFVVTAVAGEALEPPAEFNRSIISLDYEQMSDEDVKVGDVWTCKAIEVGTFRNIREKHFDLFNDKEKRPGSWLIPGPGPFFSELFIAKKTILRE